MPREPPNPELDMLRAIVQWCDERPDPDEVEVRRVPEREFRDMRAKAEMGRALSEKQREWVRGVHARLFDVTTYENAWSGGKVPKGRDVKTPEVLKNLPLKPPGRR